MAFNISPSVDWSERDETLYPQEIADNIGALAGTFLWGPVNKATLITNGEEELKNRFHTPTDDAYLAFMVASDFLSYSNKAWITRVAGPLAVNATPANQTPIRVENDDHFESSNLNGYQFIAKYPGQLGNGLTISIANSDTFDTWEYRNDFEYRPEEGEFNIAIVDGSGAFTGSGATRQSERLLISGSAKGGINQVESVVVSGDASGGVKQSERLTVVGTATEENIEIAGIPVLLEIGDNANQVALKIADEFRNNNSSPFQDVYAANNVVFVTYKEYGQHPATAAVDSAGVLITSVVTVTGNSNFIITFRGKTVNLVNGQTAEEVVGRIVSAMMVDTSTFKSVETLGANEFRFEYVDYGEKDVQTTEEMNGLFFTTTVDTVGDDKISIEVFGQNVDLINGDSPATVAGKVGVVLNAASIDLGIENVHVSRNAISYNYPEIGSQSSMIEPDDQHGISFNVSVSTPGRTGTIMEKFEIVNTIPGSRFEDGTIQYFADAINQSSRYVYVGDASLKLTTGEVRLTGGVDDNANVNPTTAYQYFLNTEEVDVNYIIDAGNPVAVQKAIADVASTRRDCFAFVSPQITDVLNNPDNVTADVVSWSNTELNKETSYLIKDCNWAYVYDKYNDKNRWIPCSGGTAGLKARTDSDAEPWISPAGYEYGRYKNYIKLAWSPNKGQRDELYKNSVNPVVSFKGEGIILYGDKTSLTRPSAFQAINVRSAFIVAQKSLANFAKYYLFKLNDEYTRAQFTNACRPFLRNMTARGAWEDVRFIADETNNGPSVRRSGQMNAKILIKPVYSINFIDLLFVAVGSEVSFDEIETGMRQQ